MQKLVANNDSTDQTTDPTKDFVPYFLNYIREESSQHFTPDVPVISPKKIKKRKKMPQRYSTSSDTSNDSKRSSARGSLFSTPPSARLGNINVSPVAGDQQERLNISSGISPPVKNQSHNSSGGSVARDVSQVTSTPVKFNLDEDFPPVSLQKSSKRYS